MPQVPDRMAGAVGGGRVKISDSGTMWAVLPPRAKSLNAALGMYDNRDSDGLRLYGISEITLFSLRKDAKEASLVWPGAIVVPVFMRKRGS